MGENARILIIDDDENIRKVLTTILEEEGYVIESVDTGKKAIERTKRNAYNLALIDIRLPDIEGIELLTKMKDTTPKMRKIIITGYPTIHNAVEAVNRGADAYILKPFDMEKVLKTIEDQLEKQQTEKTYSQEKVAEFIETRVKELETTNEIAQKKKP
jgi:DNA-binding NtrC family response regulator